MARIAGNDCVSKMPISKDILKYKFWGYLSYLPFVEEIWLFGSRARGDFRKNSDIDIAIKCPKADDRDWRLLKTIVDDISDTLLKIDLVRLDKVKSKDFMKLINRDKILVYKKGNEKTVRNKR